MKKLKVCFIGVGSIARRHIKNLTQISIADKIDLSIDICRRKESVPDVEIASYIEHIYYDCSDLPKDYDVIFITNPTEYHIDTLRKVHDCAKNFFIEKPLISIRKLEEARRFPYRKDTIYYVACPLRYTQVIQYIKNKIDLNSVIGVRSISSSYLPEWRPKVDYRKTYSADRNLGGGVSIDLIHEWDYLRYLFGMPEKICCFSGKKSGLEINSDDYAIYMAEYNDKILELHLDYFGRKSIREIMLFTTKDIIVGDLVNSEIRYLKTDKVVEFNQERDDFQIGELRHFLDIIDGRTECDNTAENACQTLNLTQGIIEV